MKTYKTYLGCKRNQQSQPFPVTRGDATVWATFLALKKMKPTSDPVVFSPILGGTASDSEHDRSFTVVSDGRDFGVLTVLSRAFSGDIPTIELFSDKFDAITALQIKYKQYSADPRWENRA